MDDMDDFAGSEDDGSVDEGETIDDVLSAAFDGFADEDDGNDGDIDLTPQGESEADEAGSSKKAEPGTPEAEPAGLPTYWSDETRAKYDALSDDAKRIVLEASHSQVADYTRKTQELAGIAGQYQEVARAVQPYQQNFQAAGIRPAQGIEILMRQENLLRNGTPEQKVAVVQGLLTGYGVPLSSILGDGSEDHDPDVGAMRQHVAIQNQKIAELQGRIRDSELHSAQQAETQAMQSVQQFISTKDADGQLAYPFVDDVHPQMAAIIRSDRSITLEQAYRMAVAGNPAAQAKQTALQDARKQTSRKARVQQAQVDPRANVRGVSRDSGGRFKATGSLEDDVSAAWDEARAG